MHTFTVRASMEALDLISPDGPIPFAIAVLAITASVLVISYLAWKHHPSYGANPGLPAFPLVGSLPVILLNRHRFYEWTSDVLNRTAPSLTVRVVLGRKVGIGTANPANVQHILKTAFESYPKGPDLYLHFSDLLGDGIFNCDGTLWRLQRKVASHEFTSNSLRDFVLEIAEGEICDYLLPALRSTCEDGCTIDLQALLMQFTFDTICQVTFGASSRCLGSTAEGNLDRKGCNLVRTGQSATKRISSDGGEDDHDDDNKLAKDFQQAFDVALRVTADRFLTPISVWRLKRALKIGSEKELLDALKVVDKFASTVIEKRKRDLEQADKSTHQHKDLLSRFIKLSKMDAGSDALLDGGTWENTKEAQEPQILTDKLLKDILLSFLLAGRESVASGVTFLMWHLMCHPKAEKALRAELDAIISSRDASMANVRTFTFDELRKMNYLHAALSESMRLYPPAPSDPKYALHDDILPDGTKVRKGYQVSYNVFAMGRAEQIWGPDCREFKPERWLGQGGQFVAESPFKYPVFQAGPRICLGKDFAYIQMKLLVASLVQGFEFCTSPKFKPQLSFGVNLAMVNGLPVTLKQRHASNVR